MNIEEFHCFKVDETCELRTFVEQELQRIHAHITTYKEGNAYFQFTCATEDIDKRKEVLLLDKVDSIEWLCYTIALVYIFNFTGWEVIHWPCSQTYDWSTWNWNPKIWL